MGVAYAQDKPQDRPQDKSKPAEHGLVPGARILKMQTAFNPAGPD